MREIPRYSNLDRVGTKLVDGRNQPLFVLDNDRGCSGVCHDEIGASALKLCDERRHLVQCVVGVDPVECHRARLGVASLKSVAHRDDKALGPVLVAAAEKADARRSCCRRGPRGSDR